MKPKRKEIIKLFIEKLEINQKCINQDKEIELDKAEEELIKAEEDFNKAQIIIKNYLSQWINAFDFYGGNSCKRSHFSDCAVLCT